MSLKLLVISKKKKSRICKKVFLLDPKSPVSTRLSDFRVTLSVFILYLGIYVYRQNGIPDSERASIRRKKLSKMERENSIPLDLRIE